MAKRVFSFGIIGSALAFFAFAAPAQAQATRTWVSGVGDDVNPCSRTAPCKTFAGAISKTVPGGEINCIDPGGFGGVTITKSITIDCLSTEAGIVVAGSNGIVVSAGATDAVVLRGIDITGTLATPGLDGIRFNSGGALHVEKCVIREFTSAAPNGVGIAFQPTAASKLFVTDTLLTGNTGAVLIRPASSGSIAVAIMRTIANSNGSGFTADTSAPSTGQINILIRNSDAFGNPNGGYAAVAVAGSGAIGFILDHSTSTSNGTGISANGPGITIAVTGSTIAANGVGLAQSNGGLIVSTGNNLLTSSGSFNTPGIPLQ
jgi:hypothetical protein